MNVILLVLLFFDYLVSLSIKRVFINLMLVIVNIIIKIFKLFVFKSLLYGFEENMFIKFYNFFVEGILVSFIN